MAGKVKMPNKKTTITIAIIIAILAVVIAIGTVVFLKDRGSTEAAEIESNQFAEQENGTTGNTPAEQNNGEVAGNQGTLPNAGEQANAENAQNPAGGVANANNGGVQNNQIAGAAGQNAAADNIQETTIQRTETIEIAERQILEGHYVGWTPMSVNADLNYAKLINAKKDNLEINKVCETKTGENTTTKGEVITYKISVRNNSEKDLEGIEVKDLIPEMTTYVENSSNVEALELTGRDGKTVVALKWNIDLKAGEAIEISFQVKVSETATGTIRNVAVVNGEETNETKTAIVTSTKTAEVIGKAEGTSAKVGDKIKYTITVKNTGDVAGKATVKDESLAKLIEDGILEVEEASKETTEKLMAGTDVEVAANSESKVEFTVVVKKVSGAIKNVATVGEEKPEETVDTTDYTIKKEVTSTAKNENGKYALGEVVTYKVTVTNIGSTVLKTVTVNDSNSEEKVRTATNIAVNGKAELTFKHIVTEADIKEGEVVNVATSDGKETEKVTVETEEPFTKYDLVKTVTGTDKDKDGKYDLGETITYKVTVTNRGNQTVKDVVVTDNNSEEKTATVSGELKPGESKEVKFTHIVTEADIKAGEVVNVATIGDDPSNEVTTETEDPITKYDLVKTVTSTAKNENGKYALGEKITYKVTVTNRGNQTVKDVVVTDNNSEEKTATVNGELKPGESKDVTFTHIVTEKDITAKKVVNVATIGDDPSNEVTTETEDPITKYDLVKTVTSTAKNENGKYALGETIAYKVTVTNRGNQTVKDIVVTDNNSEEKTATVNGELKPGESKDVTFTHIVTEKDITAKKVVNVATIGDDPSNEVTTETEDPITKYDLVKTVTSTAKNENGKYALGETITYKVTVTNRGNQTVKDVVVTDNNSEEKTATVNGELKPGESKDVKFTHIVTEKDITAKKVVNVATIGDDPSNEVTTETEDPFTKYELVKTVTSTAKNENGKYALGETITYKVTVTNRGNQTVKDIVVTDNNSEEKTATVTGELKPGESKDVTFTHVVTEADIKAGEVVNVATIGDDPSNEVTTDTEDPTTKYELHKEVTGTDANNDGKYALGETITYKVTVTNKGNQTVKDIVVTDNNSVEKTATVNGELKPGESKDVTFTHIVTEADIKAGEVVNVATIGDDSSNEEKTDTEDPFTKYELLKTVISTDANNDGKYALGETITYNVKVTNKGNQTVKNVVVTDNNSVEKTRTITEEIAPNASANVTFTHVVTEADIKAGEVVNVATIGNDSSTVTTDTEDPNPDFVVTKTATKLNGTNVNGEIAVKVGDKVTYVITVENTGNVTLENVVVTDELLPEFSHTIATLNRGADNKVSVTVEYTVQEKDIKDGKLVNIAKATIPEKEKTGEEELPVSNISIEKHVAEYKNGAYTILSTEALESTTYKVGDAVWYAITVTNNGEVADTVTVTDTLADGLAYANESSETINYNKNTKTITWNTTLEAKETKTLYIKATVTSSAIAGTPVSSITTGTTWWKTNNGNITTGKQEAAAKLFIKLDGKILENDQDNHYTDTKDYTGCVAKVNLTAKNLSGNNVQTTDANAIKVGTTVTPTTVEEYSTLNYQIFQYIVDGTDLNTIAENIKNDSKARAKGITFNPETQMIVCYVLKTESDGYHIDAVIRPKAETKIDLYNVDNIATVNGKDSEKVTIVVTDSTEITEVTVNKVWANTTNTPESVDVQLYAGTNATTETATLNEENNWTYTWDELNKYDANNKEINYSVKEINIDLENETVTAFENNDKNGDYKVTYETTGNTTTITNTFVRPEINVTKKQYNKDGNEMTAGTKVQYGDTITYKIEATNSGNAEGTVTLKDTVPTNSELVGNITLTQGRNTTRLTVDELVAGKEVTLGENETATITFTVKATAYAGEKVTNTAYYDKDDEKDIPTETTQSDIEAKPQVIPTSSTTITEPVPQRVILVLDFSASMKDSINGTTKIASLKSAVNSFLTTFLKNNNEVMIITYNERVSVTRTWTKDKNEAYNSIKNLGTAAGTNIDGALTKANEYVDDNDTNTSVILMTDGWPGYYVDNETGKTRQSGDGWKYNQKSAEEAIESAGWITDKKVKLYTIGFGLSGNNVKNFMEAMATDTIVDENGKIVKKYYHETANSSELNKAFEDIYNSVVSEADGEPIEIQTTEGKMDITDGFEAGQNVEIYTGEYTKGTSTPKATYSWNQFITLDYVQENEDGTITFNLTQYMKDNNIAANEKITIRFVDPQNTTTRMKSARLMSLVMDATEDAESEQDIAEYEQKIEKAEQAKTTAVKEDSKPATTETPNKETTNNTVVETENTKPSTDNKENDKEEIKDKENTTTTDKPVETTNTTTEETIKNNQDNETDNTTSSVNE